MHCDVSGSSEGAVASLLETIVVVSDAEANSGVKIGMKARSSFQLTAGCYIARPAFCHHY